MRTSHRSAHILSVRRFGIVAAVVITASTLFTAPSNAGGAPTVVREPFGSTAEGQVDRYTLTNGKGMRVRILTYGGIIQTIEVPDRRGRNANVALGFDNLTDYVEREPVLRLHHGPLRQPHRAGPVHPRRRHLPASDQQRPQQPARRRRRLRQAHLGGHPVPAGRHRRSRDALHEPARRPGLPRHADHHGYLHPDPGQRHPDRVPRHDRPAHGRQPHQPHLLQPGRRGLRQHRGPRVAAQREPLHTRSTRR